MDVSKFRCPRLLSGAKMFQSLWRPELHFQACLVEGVEESYYISDCDLPKDSNLQNTLLFHTLERAHRHFNAKDLPMPKCLRLHSDNCSGEVKNQWLMKAAATLIWREDFDEVWLTQFRVGHSHWKVDQRFSEARTILAHAKELQTPSEFSEKIAQRLVPRQGRTSHVAVVNASLDFKEMLDPLPMNVTGQIHAKTCFSL